MTDAPRLPLAGPRVLKLLALVPGVQALFESSTWS